MSEKIELTPIENDSETSTREQTMPEKIELTPEQIEAISAGTTHESAALAIALAGHGYGLFMKYHPEREDAIDDEGIKELFAKKGWKFVPAFGDQEQNVFYGPDGFPYGNDYIIYLIESGKF